MAFLTPPLWGSKRRTLPRCSLTTKMIPHHLCWRTCDNSLPSCGCPGCLGCPSCLSCPSYTSCLSCSSGLSLPSLSSHPGLSSCPSCLKPHLHALKNRHGMPNFWHRADDLKARHSLFSTCKCIGPKCNVAPVLKFQGCRDYHKEVVSAWVNKARCQKFGVLCWFFSTCKWGKLSQLFRWSWSSQSSWPPGFSSCPSHPGHPSCPGYSGFFQLSRSFR